MDTLDSSWDKTTCDKAACDVYLDPEYKGLGSAEESSITWLHGSNGTYKDCATDTNYGRSIFPLGHLERGEKFCVITTAKRYALLAIIEKLDDSSSVTFEVTVWNKH